MRLSRPRIDGPAPTIRLRLTVMYGIVFLITGAVLLTIGYALVRNNIHEPRIFPRPHLLPLFNSRLAEYARQVRAKIVSDALNRLLVEYLFALGVMTMIAVGTGWLLAGRALRPLREITATARRVSGENLGERIALAGPADELKELADTFDGMLERLNAAFGSQRHFVANASHELRTPLAIMRTEVDVALADPNADAAELRAMGEAVRETIDRCERLIESLLMLARSEAATGREEPVDLAALAGDCITDLHARADEMAVRISDELEPAWTRGEPALLERMIANLIDNGIRHNQHGGYLEIRTGTSGERSWVTAKNGGPVIDAADAQKLTEPFHRLDRNAKGFGLGLSIVRSVASAHGGTTSIAAPPTGGLTVHIDVPAVRVPANAPASQASRALTRS